MEFTCDPDKDAWNRRERGLPLLAAQCLFDDRMLVREDLRKPYPERRYIGYNTIENRLMVVVFCVLGERQIRIISFRKANRREQKIFESATAQNRTSH